MGKNDESPNPSSLGFDKKINFQDFRLRQSERIQNQTQIKKNKEGVEIYWFKYNAIYSLIYVTVIIMVLFFFIILRDFVKAYLSDPITNTLNRILK